MPRPLFSWAIATGVLTLAGSTSGHATEYLTLEQAQHAVFPGAALARIQVRLTPGQRAAIETASGVRVRRTELDAWRTADGRWFLTDEVLGKHEFITYACGIDQHGNVTAIEIMSYRETYGGEIRRPAWRGQFAGKNASSHLKLDDDIQNISGATLSCRHVTDGVKRLLATYDAVLKGWEPSFR